MKKVLFTVLDFKIVCPHFNPFMAYRMKSDMKELNLKHIKSQKCVFIFCLSKIIMRIIGIAGIDWKEEYFYFVRLTELKD